MDRLFYMLAVIATLVSLVYLATILVIHGYGFMVALIILLVIISTDIKIRWHDKQ